jgi:hypothetical protein
MTQDIDQQKALLAGLSSKDPYVVELLARERLQYSRAGRSRRRRRHRLTTSGTTVASDFPTVGGSFSVAVRLRGHLPLAWFHIGA